MVTLTLEAPGKNAVSSALIDSTLAKLAAAGGEPLLVAGAGDAFSAGLNLRELAGFDARGMRDYLQRFDAMVAALYQYPGPTVACVNGHAIAGGCILSLCCDFRIAAGGKAKIGLNELALGVRFPPVTFAMIQDRIPRQHLAAVVFGAQLFDPESALRMGLVDEVSSDAMAAAKARLEQLSAHPREGYAAAKRELREGRVREAQRAADWDALMAQWMSAEVRKRMQAALPR